jgi:outer membrane protein TolC
MRRFVLFGLCAFLSLAGAETRAQLPPPAPLAEPMPLPEERPFPINLPTALQLAQVRPIDVQMANLRVQLAITELQRARVLWVPTVYWGTDYYRHDGQVQDVAGTVFGTSKSAFMVGMGPNAVFAFSDALFQPLAQRQLVRARRADLQAATNDTLLAVAEA